MTTESLTNSSADLNLFKTMTFSALFINDDLRRLLHWILYAFLLQSVVLFGIVANIINIICFVKQDFNDSINISLLGLAVSDLGCLATLIFTNLSFTPAFEDLELPFESMEFQYLVSTWPHILFTRITSWITAFITLERCLCVMMPLKVKTFITPRRVIVINISIFAVLIVSFSPIYCVSSLNWRFSPQRNRTVLGLVFTSGRDVVEQVLFTLHNLCVPIGAFVVITVCTIVLVVNLRNKTKWRMQSTSGGQAQATSTRDQKVTRLVVLISTLFIACFIPNSAIFITLLIEPALNIDGAYVNTCIVMFGVGFFLESVNSAMNIFLYYHMSSKYKTVFQQIFKWKRKQ